MDPTISHYIIPLYPSLQSACAVCINTGSLADPPDIPGLAHLLEHSKTDQLQHFHVVICVRSGNSLMIGRLASQNNHHGPWNNDSLYISDHDC